MDTVATAWRVAVLRSAMHVASGLRHQAQERIAEIRRAGAKRRGPGSADLRRAQDAYRGHAQCVETLQDAVDIIVPPTGGPERCSQGWRRWYTPEQSEILRMARETQL